MPSLDFFERLGLFVRRGFLSPEVCANLCRQIVAVPAQQAQIYRVGEEERLDETVRVVEKASLPIETTSPLEEKFRLLMPELERHFGASLVGWEQPDYLIYRPGSFFKPHTDNSSHPNARKVIRRRSVSTVIFLNRESKDLADDAYGQGNLTFYRLLDGPHWEACAFPLNAEPGLLIAFPSNQIHEVTPVSFGKRLTVVTWFLGPKIETQPVSSDPLATPVLESPGQ